MQTLSAKDFRSAYSGGVAVLIDSKLRESSRRFVRFAGFVALAAAVVISTPQPAFAGAKYAGIVVDAKTGKTLYESSADAPRYPASLTKMMTLYILFEDMERGRFSRKSRLKVSKNAAAQPPTKIGLRAGQTIQVDSAIRALAVKSANDVAVTVAENVSGSVSAFARRMTRTARAIGMKKTTFRNPSGLPDNRQKTTARDMALLGRALQDRFPQYYGYFSTRHFSWGKRKYRNTNRLLGAVRGVDGIKTGYTRAAGYNLVASAHRGSKRIVATLLGGKSSRWRNARMVKLLDKGFARAGARVASVPPHARRLAVARAPLPPAKPGAPATGLEVLARMLGSQAVAATPPSNSRLAPLYGVVPPVRPGRGAAATETVNNADQMPVPPPRPRWAVQLGEFENRAIAVARVTEVTLGNVEVLASAAPVIDEIRGREGALLYRVRFVGLAPNDANRACRTLTADGRACVTLAPGT